MTRTIALPRLGTYAAWRDAARALAGAGVPPAEVAWQLEGGAPTLFDDAPTALPAPRADAPPLTVPRAFPDTARLLCAARVPGGFDLAYRLLLRVQRAPRLLSDRADAEVAEAARLAKLMRRDMHKMKAFVRFREVTPEGAAPDARRSFVAWFEPDHRIEELTAGFFARRFADMDWAIITPEVTTRFQAGALTHEAVAASRPDLTDETEELWRTYYAHIFNPARLKVRAMQSEMPQKYWKNLPEAALIPELIAGAEARAAEMRAAAPTLPPLRAGRVLARLDAGSGAAAPEAPEGLPTAAALNRCTLCPLAGPATQAVPGDGPDRAPLMIVGEQPGDQEDLTGRPFVGPAGQLFDEIAARAGLDRSAAYVTNAVKHFKFQVRGKRRIHQSPNVDEIAHCRWWLTREIAQVQPLLIVAMGATAAQALTGSGKNITRRRGTLETSSEGVPVFLTLHPAALLRAPDAATRAARTDEMAQDLAQVAALLADLPQPDPAPPLRQ